MQWQQQAYWRYSKIRDDSIRGAFKILFHDSFDFEPEFPNFIFEPWTSMLRKERDDSSKKKDDEAKDGSNFEGSANK